MMALIALGLVGCSVQSSALDPSADASVTPDIGMGDALTPDTGDALAVRDARMDGDARAMDSAMSDAGASDGALDTAIADATPDDASSPPDASETPDTAAPPDTSPPPSCDSLFSSFVPRYELCRDSAAECEFYTYTAGGPNCRELCTMAGLTCVTSYAEGATNCTRSSDYGCEYRHTDGICICMR